MTPEVPVLGVLGEGRCLAQPPHVWMPADLSSSLWQQSAQDPDEPLGSKEKHWVLDKGDHPWLLKYARNSGSGVSGEHWAECVVHSLAGLLGVPTACVRPALDGERHAVLSRSVLHDERFAGCVETRLEHGSELLSRTVADYDVTVGDNNPEYTVSNVKTALSGIDAPDATNGGMDGFSVWCGYVLLDAWVSGCDRHHDNWAVATDSNGRRRLVESFDHGNALGFQESESHLRNFQSDEGIVRWLERGKTHFAGHLSPMVVAREALKIVSSSDRVHWLDRLRSVRLGDVEKIVRAVPEKYMSEARCRFVLGILENSWKKMTDEIAY